jgi:hypothetical protein
MFAQSGGYSLSDIAAVSGNNNRGGFGDDYWWIILIFLFGFGNNGWGNGGNGRTTEDISYSFDMNGLENGVRGIQQGLCDGFYAVNTGMLNGFSGIQNSLCQGFAGVTAGMNANTNVINAGLTGLGTQMAQCCCDIRYENAKNFADLNYNLATQACETRHAITDSTRQIIDFLTQDKIATLTAENQSLKFAASQAAQNAFIAANQDAQTAELLRKLDAPVPVPAYVVPNPNCCYNPCGGCN